MVFDSRSPTFSVKTNELPRQDWSDFYKDVKEQVPHDAPEPRGQSVELTAFVDSDHAGDTVTRQSRTGIFLFIQNALIVWISKKQTSIETSNFGSEFSAMKTAVEKGGGPEIQTQDDGSPHQWTLQCQGRQHVHGQEQQHPRVAAEEEEEQFNCL